jgi:succinate dehydrogenase / fumarate reductase iron-sulfur subunit
MPAFDAKPHTFNIRRYDPETDDAAHYQQYTVAVTEGMTVLEALLKIQAEQDGSLAFRYSCRGAVCGSCAMHVNGQVGLACRVQVRELGTDTITVEPLPNFEVLKDLVVEMDDFFAKVESVEPWLQPEGADPERERIVVPEDWTEAEPYTNCILCASCHGVCPALEEDPAYLGPAVLAAQYRFLADIRDGAEMARLRFVDGDAGVWGCDMVWNCVEVCPKSVTPTPGIGRTRVRIRRAKKDGRLEE